MITATGIGSGLDIENLVTQLVAAEGATTGQRLSKQESAYQAELSALGAFKGTLSAFQGSLGALNSVATFTGRTVEVGDSAVLTASVTSAAAVGNFDVGVTQLAQSHALASGVFASATEAVGAGALTIRFGATDYDAGTDTYNGFTVNSERGTATLTIDSTNNTLEGVRDTINGAGIGVSAVIVNDGSGYRLLLSSEHTGVANSLEISVGDSDGDSLDNNGLSAFAFNSQATHLSQTAVAQDAYFSVNGLAVQSATNRVANVIEGIEFQLKDTTGATPIRVTVGRDRDTASNAIKAFVSGYNNFVAAVNTLAGYNTTTGVGGILQGDFTVRSISAQIRQRLNDAIAGLDAPFNTLSEIGITTSADGKLSVNDSVLGSVIDDHLDDLAGLFAAVGAIGDSRIDYLGASADTATGDYAVNITQLATQGYYQGASVLPDFAGGGQLTIDDTNDTFSLTVDGIASGTIVIGHGDYTSGAALAAEIQARINGDSALNAIGASVLVSYAAGDNTLVFTSASYGSDSQLEFTAVDASSAATLGISVGTGVAGLNVAGTIGGEPATGVGQTLTAAQGLKLLVNGGALGNRGTLTFTRGVANRVDSLLQQWLQSDGVLDNRVDNLQDRIDDIGDRRQALERRLNSLEARLRSQFNALDTLVNQLQSTGNFLTQQLSSLPGSTPIE